MRVYVCFVEYNAISANWRGTKYRYYKERTLWRDFSAICITITSEIQVRICLIEVRICIDIV